MTSEKFIELERRLYVVARGYTQSELTQIIEKEFAGEVYGGYMIPLGNSYCLEFKRTSGKKYPISVIKLTRGDNLFSGVYLNEDEIKRMTLEETVTRVAERLITRL